MKNTVPVYAVVRLDSIRSESQDLKTRFTIKEIVMSQIEAEAEIERLNRLNSEKGCEYFWTYTRLVKKDAHEEKTSL